MLEVKNQNDIQAYSVFDMMKEGGHEQVVFCKDKDTGLKAIIAIHNTTLGPALGGTRMSKYDSEQDALRLSRGMTYKAAVTSLKLGGGKAVIIGDSKKDKTESLFRSYGRFVESLNGVYITAEYVGTSMQDMEYVSMETKHVTGIPEAMGGGGDPSPVTAYGVYMGMKAAAKQRWGNESLEGKKVVVQGLGHVGTYLVEYLIKEGAKVFGTDIHADHVDNAVKKFGITVVAPDAIYDVDADIYAPCALGATLNTDTISRLRCSIVAGSANNQFANEAEHSRMLSEKGILYAPDFLINAGGLINVYSELNGFDRKKAMEKTEHIYRVTLDIFERAIKENITTDIAAKRAAEEKLKAADKEKAAHV